jgi:SNF2 family DNA or RNA helicase
VWTSVSFSLDDWQQGNARLRRPGQKNPVVIHTLTTPDTIDEHVLAVLEGKKTVQQALLDALR